MRLLLKVLQRALINVVIQKKFRIISFGYLMEKTPLHFSSEQENSSSMLETASLALIKIDGSEEYDVTSAQAVNFQTNKTFQSQTRYAIYVPAAVIL